MRTDEMLYVLLQALRMESQSAADVQIPESTEGKWRLLQALMSVRTPIPMRPELLEIQDRLLALRRALSSGKGISQRWL